MGACGIEEFLDGGSNDREHIIVEIEVNDVLETEPLRVVQPAALLQRKRLKATGSEEEPYMLSHLSFFGCEATYSFSPT